MFTDASPLQPESASRPPPEPVHHRPRIGTREALRFLVEAGQTLASTLEYERALQALADLAVPRVACMCVVDVLEPDEGGLRALAVAHVDPARLPLLRRSVAEVRGPESPSAIALRQAGPEPVLVSPVTDRWLRENTQSEEELRIVRELAPTSLMHVPLLARGSRLGVLTLASTRTDRYYQDDDLMLARELGRISAVAIDNARLYRQAQEAVQAREEVLRVVSHDLRNPISAVTLGASYLLEEATPELREGPAGHTLRTMLSSMRSASRLIEDLLDVSRIEAGSLAIEPAPVSVGPIVREAIETQRPGAVERGIELVARLDEPLPPVLADRDRLLQVLGNLLTNAFKFTPPGGRVEVGASPEGDAVRWWVQDTGPGIPPEQLPHLFDRFWQARRSDRRGLGLGLAIVKGLVEAHGGRVWVESEPGGGCRFQFTVPAEASGGGMGSLGATS